jgi:hypothetical protein
MFSILVQKWMFAPKLIKFPSVCVGGGVVVSKFGSQLITWVNIDFHPKFSSYLFTCVLIIQNCFVLLNKVYFLTRQIFHKN